MPFTWQRAFKFMIADSSQNRHYPVCLFLTTLSLVSVLLDGWLWCLTEALPSFNCLFCLLFFFLELEIDESAPHLRGLVTLVIQPQARKVITEIPLPTAAAFDKWLLIVKMSFFLANSLCIPFFFTQAHQHHHGGIELMPAGIPPTPSGICPLCGTNNCLT